MRISIWKLNGILLCIVVLSGCSGPLVKSAITSNTVQEDAHNSFLLLNIVRARERMPMHFTQVNAVRAVPGGLGIGTPSIGLEIPFGGAADANYKFSSGLEGTSTVDTVSLVSQEFTRGLTAPVDPDMVAYFANQGWPLSMLLYMFVGSVEAYDDKGNMVRNLVNSPRDPSFPLFGQLVDSLAACQLSLSKESSPSFYSAPLRVIELKDLTALADAKEAGLDVVRVGVDGKVMTRADQANQPLNEQYIRFAKISERQEFSLASRAGMPTQDCNIDTADFGSAAPKAALIPLPSSKMMIRGFKSAVSRLFSKGPQSTGQKLAAESASEVAGSPSAEALKIDEAKLVLRSTQSMLYYLGELSRNETESSGPFIKVRNKSLDDYKKAYLFKINCCERDSAAAVAVAYRQKNYSLSNYSKTENDVIEDRSIQTLSLVSLVFSLQNRSAEAPTISNVRVLSR